MGRDWGPYSPDELKFKKKKTIPKPGGKGNEVSHSLPREAPNDPVNNPAHYCKHPAGVECIQVTEHFGFNLGNVIKYIWRAEEKGAPLQDLKKALWYLSREIAKREKNA